jgi:phosphatidate cytidylyltransferase
MKVRFIVATILLPLLPLIALVLPKIVTAFVVAGFCTIAAYELMVTTKLVTPPRLIIYGIVMAFCVPFWSYYGEQNEIAVGGALAFFTLIYSEILFSKGKIPFNSAAVCFVAGILIPYLFSALVRIMILDAGRVFLLLPFTVSVLSDSGAYFVGVFFGRHKLAPAISPHKTVEGMWGGVAIGTIGVAVYGLVLQLFAGMQVNYLYALLYGFVGSLFGVFGDLSFSVIKRQVGIKDYGSIFPGHGGILDRFDSLITVAPLMELLLLLIPFAK